MHTLFVLDQDNNQHEIPALEGWSLMEIIRDAGLPIKAECGGACSCATCHVYIDSEWLDKLHAMREEEQEMLDEAFDVDDDHSRLACQIVFTEKLNGMTVRLASYG